MIVRSHLGFGDEEARVIGDDIEQPASQESHEARTTWRSWCRASFQMRAFEDRFITLGVFPTAWWAALASTSAPKSAMRWPISR